MSTATGPITLAHPDDARILKMIHDMPRPVKPLQVMPVGPRWYGRHLDRNRPVADRQTKRLGRRAACTDVDAIPTVRFLR